MKDNNKEGLLDAICEHVDENSVIQIAVRMHFLVNSFFNVYVQSESNMEQSLIIGEPLPSKLTSANKFSHLMSVDKIVA